MILESLPLFSQFIRVLCSYRISSFQVCDIFSKVVLLGVENNNTNYQNTYRLVQRFVKDGYFIIDDLKDPYTTYSETEKLMALRDQFCSEPNATIEKIIKEQRKLELEIFNLGNEIEVYDELKQSYPDLQFKIEQLKIIKDNHLNYLKNRLKALTSLSEYISH